MQANALCKEVSVIVWDMYQVVAVVLDVIYVIIRCLFERQKQHSLVKLSVHSVVQCFLLVHSAPFPSAIYLQSPV